MELTGEQLKVAETQLKKYFPRSLSVYGCLVRRKRSAAARSVPIKVFVDKWPEFNVMICKPQNEEKEDLFKYTVVFANDKAFLEETLRNSSIIDWTRYMFLGTNLHYIDIFKAVASEKDASGRGMCVCHKVMLEDVSNLPSIDSSGISLSSLDESHVGLVNQTWKYAENDDSAGMISYMLACLPSCCVLDADAKPVSWVLTYATGAMGMLYTLPEHRGKGYAKVLVSTVAERFQAEGYPVYCFIEEGNLASYRLFKNLGFTEDPSYREIFYEFNV